MCSYCGCRSITPIDRFSAEHDDIINVTGELCRAARADDRDAATRAVDQLTALLGRHTADEERSLFVALRADPMFTDHIETLCSEHRAIESVLARVLDGDLGWAATLERSLRQHIDKEENGLFPAAVIALDAAALAEMAEPLSR
jgi:hemerythrin-like domain-containing protein